MNELATGNKLKRKFMGHYIDSAVQTDEDYAAVYTLLGKGLEEYTVEMNANVEKTKDITGNTVTEIDSYEPQASVEPYKAVIGDPLFARLQAIVDGRLTMDDLKTKIVEVHLWEPVSGSTGTYKAFVEDAMFEVVSYGGDTSAYQIPFNVHHCGNRVEGTFAVATKTFTAATD